MASAEKGSNAGGRKQLPATTSRSVLSWVNPAPSMEHLSLENALGVPIPGDSTIKAQAQPRAGGGWQCWLHSEVSAPNGRSASCVMTAVSQGPPKSRIPSTRRRPCALLNPKPQHLQLNDRFPAILKLLSKMLQSKMTHSIFFLHRGFQKTVQ